MKRQIPADAAAATSDAAKKRDTSQVLAPDLLPRNSGPSDGSTIARLAVNMDGVEVRLVNP